jgi:hypothetical protein
MKRLIGRIELREQASSAARRFVASARTAVPLSPTSRQGCTTAAPLPPLAAHLEIRAFPPDRVLLPRRAVSQRQANMVFTRGGYLGAAVLHSSAHTRGLATERGGGRYGTGRRYEDRDERRQRDRPPYRDFDHEENEAWGWQRGGGRYGAGRRYEDRDERRQRDRPPSRGFDDRGSDAWGRSRRTPPAREWQSDAPSTRRGADRPPALDAKEITRAITDAENAFRHVSLPAVRLVLVLHGFLLVATQPILLSFSLCRLAVVLRQHEKHLNDIHVAAGWSTLTRFRRVRAPRALGSPAPSAAARPRSRWRYRSGRV